MKRFLYKVRNFILSFVLCAVVLCSGIGGSYYTGCYEVHAASITTTLLPALIEAVMASMGLTFSSTTDLNNVVSGLDGLMDSNPDYLYKGISVFTAIKETLQSAKLGATISLPYLVVEWLSKYFYNVSADVMTESVDVVYESASLDISGVQVIYGNFSKDFFMSRELFYGFPVVNSSNDSITIFDDEPIFLDSCKLVVTIYNETDKKYSILYTDNDVIIAPRLLDAPTQLGSKDGFLIDSVFELYYDTGIAYPFKQCYFTWNDYNGGRFKTPVSGYQYTYKDDTGNSYCRIKFVDSDYSGSGINKYTVSNYLPATSTNAEVRIFVNSGTSFYESYDEYKMMHPYEGYLPVSAVYGSTASSKSFETDEEDEEKVLVQIPESSITSKVETAVNNALAENPSITEEELNAVASDMVSVANGIKDSVDENTGAVEESNTLLGNILNVLEGLCTGILEGLVSLFVPDEGYFEDFFDRLNSFFADKLGMLYTPIDMFIQFLNAVNSSADSESGSAVIIFPELKWQEYIIVEKHVIDLQSIAGQLGGLQDAIYFGTDVVMVGSVLLLLQNKLREVLKT